MLYVCYKAKILALTPKWMVMMHPYKEMSLLVQPPSSLCATTVTPATRKRTAAYQRLPVFPALFFFLHTWGLAGAHHAHCVQYIFNMSLGTTVATSVATAAFLDYVWGTLHILDAGLETSVLDPIDFIDPYDGG